MTQAEHRNIMVLGSLCCARAGGGAAGAGRCRRPQLLASRHLWQSRGSAGRPRTGQPPRSTCICRATRAPARSSSEQTGDRCRPRRARGRPRSGLHLHVRDALSRRAGRRLRSWCARQYRCRDRRHPHQAERQYDLREQERRSLDGHQYFLSGHAEVESGRPQRDGLCYRKYSEAAPPTQAVWPI